MKHTGSEFYDNHTAFQNYMDRRNREENANDTLEKPIIQELMGSVNSLKILDLGCGDARFGLELLSKGCSEYIGIEGSGNMVKAAEHNLAGTDGKVTHTLIEEWNPPANIFDIVVSRLVLHYIEDLEAVFHKVHKTLKPDGRFIFSVEHPVITSTLQTSGLRTSWIVDNYFSTGYREQEWLGGTAYKYHRTLEDYFSLMQKTGFTINQLRESRPDRTKFLNEETYNRRMRIPLFLFMGGSKIS
jgi:SAM-dependent methyltransferase